MTELVVQSALALYAQPPRLPDGWHVRHWSVTVQRPWYPDGDVVEVACALLHESAVAVELNVRFPSGSPPDLDWLRPFLDGALSVPHNVYARVDRRVL